MDIIEVSDARIRLLHYQLQPYGNLIAEANFNHKNDTFEEFVSLPDWAMRIVPIGQYKKGVGYIFCNPPQ